MRVKTLVLSLLIVIPLWAEQLPMYLDYINQYKKIAIEQQQQYKIPASITMAQGLLESGAGKSELATNANNHFGIKCTSDWQGESYRHDDETKNECFRKYRHAEESYVDHSKFLLRSRYASLFELDMQDYKGWAHGLRQCGYATDPKYPEKLIRIIEDYRLDLLVAEQGAEVARVKDGEIDTLSALDTVEIVMPLEFEEAAQMEDVELYHNHRSGYQDGLHYIIAEQGETFASLAYFLNMSEKSLRKFNDATNGRELEKGDRVYLFPKHHRAGKKHATYYVRKGDTAWSIAQMFAIRVKDLYRINGIPQDTPLTTRQKLRLR